MQTDQQFAAMLLRTCKRLAGKPADVTHMDLILVASGCGTFLIPSAYVFRDTKNGHILICKKQRQIFEGFGDFVALQKESASQSSTEYVTFTLIFIMF
ncbi:hypothetical protein X798_07619, partial [Onchocerca flexuosa]